MNFNTSTNINNQSNDCLSHLAFLTGLGPGVDLSFLIDSLKKSYPGIIGYSKLPKRRTGYTFIAFDDKDSLSKFLELKEFTHKGRKLSIKPYLTGEKLAEFKLKLNKRRLFVNLIPKNWDDATLYKFFSQFGGIESAFIIRERKTKVSRGFGYVITNEIDLANKIAEMNSFDISDSEHIVAWIHKARKPKNQSNKAMVSGTKPNVEPKI